MAEDIEMATEPALERAPAPEPAPDSATASESAAEPEPAPEPTPDPEPESASTSAPQPQPASEPQLTSEPGPEGAHTPVKLERRVRTRTLFTVALALGVVGGVVGGYTVQALRKPTPLPPLAVAQPVYPRSPIFDGTRAPALPTAQDDATIVDGDLTKLLLPTPAGATAGFYDHEWVELSQDAADCAMPEQCFTNELSGQLARIAATTWTRSDGLYVEIRIYQYLPGSSSQVATELAQERNRQNPLTPPEGIAAAGDRFVGSGGDNEDFAIAAHGDVSVYFWVTSSSHVPDPSVINDLITQQMARL